MKKELINKTITYRMGVCFQSFEYCDNMELSIIECSTNGPDNWIRFDKGVIT